MPTALALTASKLLRRTLQSLCLAGISVGFLIVVATGTFSLAADTKVPSLTIVNIAQDGNTMFLGGELGHVGALPTDDREAVERGMEEVLAPALESFHLTPDSLKLRKVNSGADGSHHLRYDRTLDGLEVIGGDLVVHVDRQGVIYAINGSALGKIPTDLGKLDIGASAARSSIERDTRYAGMSLSAPRIVIFVNPEGENFKAYEIIVEGKREANPVRDKVYVDVDTGRIVGVHPQIHFLKNRSVFSANNASSLPGSPKRSEGEPTTGDVDVNAAYDNAGDTYEAYKNFWNRDSYDNAGATIRSTVHYGTNFCNAFWNGSQLVFGDGNPAESCFPLARAIDAAAHEYTHAITERESSLVLSGESGGLNEAMSDIFGAFAEAWVDGNRTGTLVISGDTWKVGEEVLPPAIRYMNDPAADGNSLDYWTNSAGTAHVLHSSGIANLAFYLMSQGGTHPRGKSSIVVSGIGMEKAVRVFYKANVDILTSNSKFGAARLACEQAAIDLGFTAAEQAAVSNAWQAVGVMLPATPQPSGVYTLTNGTIVSGISGVKDSEQFFKLDVPTGQTQLEFKLAGGTGDADLYVQRGSLPTTSGYMCRSNSSVNTETCRPTPPNAGIYFVMVKGYSNYANTTLVGKYGAAPTGSTSPFEVTNLSATTGNTRSWKVTPGAGRRLTVTIRGGTGDADLYTRRGSAPTTSAYDCRPYTQGNNETCTVPSTAVGDYYIMLRAFRAYSGVTLKVDF